MALMHSSFIPPQVDKPYKEKVVTYIGRITFQKGPEYFVETARKLLKYDDNADLLWRVLVICSRIVKLAARYHRTRFIYWFLKVPE